MTRTTRDDVIFGGWDNDFLHGGSGDDAISGAEAWRQHYVQHFNFTSCAQTQTNYCADGVVRDRLGHPWNPGNILQFGADSDAWHSNGHTAARLGEFLLYDEYDPRREILFDGTGATWGCAATIHGGHDCSGDNGPISSFPYSYFLNNNANDGRLTLACIAVDNQGNCTAFSQDPTKPNDPNAFHNYSDGDDAVFGDLGNDWLIGGTGQDTLWGGWGNDLLNADDDVTTGCVTYAQNGSCTVAGHTALNDIPDGVNSSYQDRAFGGAGLDILIANTGGDRLIDWVGEFNSYLVPFSRVRHRDRLAAERPGAARVPVRALALAGRRPDARDRHRRRSGAERRAATASSGSSGSRITGSGRTRRAARPTRRPATSRAGSATRSAAPTSTTARSRASRSTAANFTVSGGQLQVAAASLGEGRDRRLLPRRVPPDLLRDPRVDHDAEADGRLERERVRPVRLLVADRLQVRRHRRLDQQDGDRPPRRDRLALRLAVARQRRGEAGHALRRRRRRERHVRPGLDQQLAVVQLHVRAADARPTARKVGLNKGLLGFGSNNAQGVFDNISVQTVRTTTLDTTKYFEDGQAEQFIGPSQGAWAQTGGRNVSVAPANAYTLTSVDLGTNISSSSEVEVNATLNTNGVGGIAFDVYAANDFKFAALDIAGQRIVFGHVDPKRGWVEQGSFAAALTAGTDYVLDVELNETVATFSLNGNVLGSFAFNAAVSDGKVGLITRGGTTSVDRYEIKTNDAFFTGSTQPPEIRVSSGAVPEGNSGQAQVQVAVSLTAPAPVATTVGWQTIDGSATSASGDYVAGSGTITFAAGSTTAVITVFVKGDTTIESDETFGIQLTSAPGFNIAKGTGTITITNDDLPPLTVSIGNATATEGNSGTATVNVPVTLSRASTTTVTVVVTTVAGTAKAGTDFTQKTQTLSFAPGVTSLNFQVAIVGDTVKESTETFTAVALEPDRRRDDRDGHRTVTIVDNDGAMLAASPAPAEAVSASR